MVVIGLTEHEMSKLKLEGGMIINIQTLLTDIKQVAIVCEKDQETLVSKYSSRLDPEKTYFVNNDKAQG